MARHHQKLMREVKTMILVKSTCSKLKMMGAPRLIVIMQLIKLLMRRMPLPVWPRRLIENSTIGDTNPSFSITGTTRRLGVVSLLVRVGDEEGEEDEKGAVNVNSTTHTTSQTGSLPTDTSIIGITGATTLTVIPPSRQLQRKTIQLQRQWGR